MSISGEQRAASHELWDYECEAQQSGHQVIAGVDEAGRGPLAGPVVAAAVILPQDVDLDGVTDSKALTAQQREEAYEKIQSKAAAIGVGIVDTETIDRINILQATFEAMRLALADMGTAYDFVLVDGDKTIPRIFVDQKAVVGGDAKCPSISAASIIAKVTRDRIMTDLAEEFPQYGFQKHKGYCTPEHLSAIEEHGICRIHRKSFSPCSRKAEEDCLQKGLF